MSAIKTANMDDDRATGGEPPIPAVATAPEAQGTAADQAAIIQAVLANYVEILRAGEIHPSLTMIAVKNAGEACSARFLDLSAAIGTATDEAKGFDAISYDNEFLILGS